MKLPPYIYKCGFLILIKEVKTTKKGNDLYADVNLKVYNLWKIGLQLAGLISFAVVMWCYIHGY